MAVLQWAKGHLARDKVGISHKQLADLAKPDVNIVHLRRPDARHRFNHAQLKQLVESVGHYKQQVSAAVRDPEPAAHELTAELQQYTSSARTISLLQEDICSLATQYADVIAHALGGRAANHVHVKLEVLGYTPCPRWHADHVTARLLCTYTGPGTWFIANRHVKRRLGLAQGQPVTAVASVAEDAALQAGPMDLLLLKGYAWPGHWGLGAVHRSPLLCEEDRHTHQQLLAQEQSASTELSASVGAQHQGSLQHSEHNHHACGDSCTSSGLRLLLTVDDAQFGWMHGADSN